MVLAWDHASSNLGDLAVTAGCLALLAKVTPDLVQVLRLGDTAPDDAVVIYGGGEHLGPADLQLYGAPLRSARRAVVLPSTFGPFPDARPADVRAIFGAHPVAARDTESAAMMTQLLGRTVPALIDPAAFLAFPTPGHGGGTLYAPRREDLGLRLGRWATKSKPGATEAWRRYRGMLRDHPGTLVAHSALDVPLVKALSRATGAPWVRPTALAQLLGLYAKADRVVTSRYHGALFARVLGKPLQLVAWPQHGHKFSGLDRDPGPLMERTLAWAQAALA